MTETRDKAREVAANFFGYESYASAKATGGTHGAKAADDLASAMITFRNAALDEAVKVAREKYGYRGIKQKAGLEIATSIESLKDKK